MRTSFYIYIACLSFSISAQAQEKTTDSKTTDSKETVLEEIVVSGQYNPQAVNKSISEVKVITREMIDRQAGNNLADVLNQTLNLNIRPNNSTGKSGIEMFGLDSRYIKILVDNIPLLNDEGLGNNSDLTQINLDDIERIEIIEGSKGVTYGANAIAGVINIITKKSSNYKWQFTPSVQEETIGKEYNLNTKGRHIQSLKVAHNFTDALHGNVIFSRNDFKGFWGDHQGKTHLENDGLRGYEWLPKVQNSLKATLSYRKDYYQLFYKFDFFDETTTRYNEVVLLNEQPETQTSQPTANDRVFNSKRFYHHLNVSGYFNNILSYNISASYQNQKRSLDNYQYRIRTDEKFDSEKRNYESREVYYSKGTFSSFLQNKTFDFQLGYEVNEMNGYASSISGSFNQDISRRLGSYDVFGSSEITVNSKFSLRPGARIMFSSQFKTEAALEFGTKYTFNPDLDLRLDFATSPRVPSYDELYTYFVDVNHNVQGNPNLGAEHGKSVFLHLRKKHSFEKFQSESKISSWYIDVSDRIDLIIVNPSPLAYKYMNIAKYKSTGISYTNSFKYKDFSGNFGVTYGGTRKDLVENNPDNKFLFAAQVNLNGTYVFPKTNTMISVFYKYNGKLEEFVQKVDVAQKVTFARNTRQAYSWLDASVKQNFFGKKLEATIGARNILNIVNVRSGIEGSGAHSGPANNISLGYGRSYFLKLLYNFTI